MNNACGHFPQPEAEDIITPSDQLAKVISWRGEGGGEIWGMSRTHNRLTPQFL